MATEQTKARRTLTSACAVIEREAEAVTKALVPEVMEDKGTGEVLLKAPKLSAEVWVMGLQWLRDDWATMTKEQRFKAIELAQKAFTSFAAMVPKEKDSRELDVDVLIEKLRKDLKLPSKAIKYTENSAEI